MQRPFALWLLAFFLLFLAFGGLYGGIYMLTDPTGNSLQMADVLPLLPVPDYILPGLFLFFVMGLIPLLLTFALVVRPNWPWAEKLVPLKNYYWAWTAAISIGVILTIFLSVQGMLIGFKWPIQYMTATNAALIIILTATPGIKNYFRN